MNMKQFVARYSQTLMFLATLSWMQAPAIAMQTLDDQQLSQETGQAAFYTNYIGPADLGNPNGSVAGSTANIGFYTLGLNGTISLNANINRLQLGCGGVKGPGCDIDLSQVRLTGSKAGPSGTFADSDAVMQNPFLQLAIQNPTSLSTRHVLGVAFGAQNADAVLSVGQNPPSTSVRYQTSCGGGLFTSCTPAAVTTSAAQQQGGVGITYDPGIPGGTAQTITTTNSSNLSCAGFGTCYNRKDVTVTGGETGINSLSGNFQVAVANIKIPTTISGTLIADGSGDLYLKTQNNPAADNFQPENGVCDAYGHCGFGGNFGNAGSNSGKTGTFFQYASGSRVTGLSMRSLLLDLSNIGGLAGAIGNGYAQIRPQNLIDVHNLVASSNANQGLLLSLNSTQITWPQVGTAGVYSFPTTTQFLNSSSVPAAITAQSLAAQQGWWLSVPQATIGGTAGAPLNTAPVVLNGLGNVLSSLGSPGAAVPSLNLQQVPVPNCYNGAKFC
ncbi:MAG: hypothetical protein NVS3B3_05860 [Aquirhabdus sp.]